MLILWGRIYEKKRIPGFYSDGLVDNIQTLILQNGMGYIDVANKKVLFGGEKFKDGAFVLGDDGLY